jgi:hypothetical protein
MEETIEANKENSTIDEEENDIDEVLEDNE